MFLVGKNDLNPSQDRSHELKRNLSTVDKYKLLRVKVKVCTDCREERGLPSWLGWDHLYWISHLWIIKHHPSVSIHKVKKKKILPSTVKMNFPVGLNNLGPCFPSVWYVLQTLPCVGSSPTALSSASWGWGNYPSQMLRPFSQTLAPSPPQPKLTFPNPHTLPGTHKPLLTPRLSSPEDICDGKRLGWAFCSGGTEATGFHPLINNPHCGIPFLLCRYNPTFGIEY